MTSEERVQAVTALVDQCAVDVMKTAFDTVRRFKADDAEKGQAMGVFALALAERLIYLDSTFAFGDDEMPERRKYALLAVEQLKRCMNMRFDRMERKPAQH